MGKPSEPLLSPFMAVPVVFLSDRLFQTLFEAALDAMVVVDDHGRYVAANRAAGELFGVAQAELIGLCMADFTPPDPDLTRAWQGFQRQGEERGEFCLQRADGSLRQVEYVATANFIPHYHLSVIRDITPQKQLEQQLHDLNRALEEQVVQRTAELQRVNGELQAVNQQLEASQKKYHTLFEILPVGVSITDAAGNLIEVNAASAEILGISTEEHIQRTFDEETWQIIHADGRPMVSEDYASVRALREQRVIQGEEKGVVRPDGSIRWLTVNATPIPLEGYGVMIAYLDMTERKQAELALKQSENRWLEISKSSPGNIYILVKPADGSFYFEFISQAVEAIHEIPPQVILADARVLWDSIHPDDRPGYEAAVEASETTLQPFHHEWRVITPSGQIKWLQGNSRPQRRDHGAIAWYGVVQDISDHKQAELDLAATRNFLRLVLDHLPLAVFAKEAQTLKFTLWNSACTQLMGYSPDQALGKTDYDLFPAKQADRWVADDREAICSGRVIEVPEETIVGSDGTSRIITNKKVAVYDTEGQPQLVIGIAEDITRRKATEAALKDSQARLDLFFSQSLDGFFFMMLDQPIAWNDAVDKAATLDYVFAHQRITRVNEALLAQYGATAEQMLGRTPADRFAHAPEYGRTLWQQFFDQGHLRVETNERKIDGTPMIIEGDYVCIYDQQGRITGHFGVQREITDRKRQEAATAHRHGQLQAQQFVMMELSQRQELYTGELDTALQAITEVAAHALQVDRMSVWWLQNHGETLVCADRFNRRQNSHGVAAPFILRHYPIYVEALTNHRLIAAPEARSDLRLQEFVDSYFQPEGIVSVMDVPIRLEGQLVGLLCFEQLETPCDWAIESQHFAAYLANLVALINEVGDRKAAEANLQQREQEFRALAEHTPDCILRCDRQFRFRYTNPAVTALTKIPSSDFLGKTSQELGFSADLVGLWQGAMEQAFATGKEQSLEYSIALASGQKTFYSHIVPEFGPEGTVETVLVVARDITDLKRAQDELFQQAEREHTLRLITQHMRETLDLEAILSTAVTEIQRTLQADRTLIFRLNSDHSGVVIQEAVCPGYPTTVAMRWEDECFPPECYAAYVQGQARIVTDVALDSWGKCLVEFMAQTGVRSKMVAPILQTQADGATQVWGLLITHACDPSRQWHPDELELLQQVAEQLAIALQQAELHQQLQAANRELERISNTDALTNIANRRCFDQVFAKEWRRARRDHRELTLILCDIDYFKQYNDTYGHPAGDACLVAVTQALQHCINRVTDCLARYGGEEFAIILPHTDSAGAIVVVQHMQTAIAALDLDHGAHPTAGQVTLSFGLATVQPQADLNSQDLVRRADRALYQAKQTGRDRWCIDP